MHGVRWRRKVSRCKGSDKMLMMLVVRTKAMEAQDSPGSMGECH